MKSRLTLIRKLKICLIFLKDGVFNNGLVEQCPRCGSTSVTNIQSAEKDTETGSEYSAIYSCNKCDAVATVEEHWQYNVR